MAKRDYVPRWRRILAAILDFMTVFLLGGYAIAKLTGNTTAGGFELNGAPALLLFALVAAYFAAGWLAGGTIWQKILRTR
ncbi:MAG: hypothetical protein AB7E80_04225 [Hyphomicrobiaceae bacterium]